MRRRCGPAQSTPTTPTASRCRPRGGRRASQTSPRGTTARWGGRGARLAGAALQQQPWTHTVVELAASKREAAPACSPGRATPGGGGRSSAGAAQLPRAAAPSSSWVPAPGRPRAATAPGPCCGGRVSVAAASRRPGGRQLTPLCALCPARAAALRRALDRGGVRGRQGGEAAGGAGAAPAPAPAAAAAAYRSGAAVPAAAAAAGMAAAANLEGAPVTGGRGPGGQRPRCGVQHATGQHDAASQAPPNAQRGPAPTRLCIVPPHHHHPVRR
jgi:hypothetical protein